ncbi:hypothetical protein H4219_003595 [Mycoemilia scoparia]|uniref:FAD/NAD(P)-binding domain-containing protein n=1 Tax=Mycoemilia scoparia TaxID=417184 RepID=A0A9W8DP19_9FUNG|nr:hypothetical protein H4219_003595 [Mycoemilia scoparia]
MSSTIIRVVVVGAASAGATAAKSLSQSSSCGSGPGNSKVQVTVVERRDHYFHNIGALHGSVEPTGFLPKLFLPLDRLFESKWGKCPRDKYKSGTSSSSGGGSDTVNEKARGGSDDDGCGDHSVVRGTLTETHPNHIVLDNGQELPFDYLVLATGSDNHSPAKIVSLTREDGIKEIRGFNQELEKASKVLIIGGGAVGVELAGEIATKYGPTSDISGSGGSKAVTLVHGNSKLGASHLNQKFHDDVKAKLEQLGVNVYLNERIIMPPDVKLDNKVCSRIINSISGKEFESDLQILATGNRINTDYMKTLAPTITSKISEKLDSIIPLVDPETNHIRVKPTLQLADPAYPHIFAPGDVNDLPHSEKNAMKAKTQGDTVAKNIKALIDVNYHGLRKSGNIKEANEALEKAALSDWSNFPRNTGMVTVGPNMGSVQFLGWNLTGGFGNFVIRKTKGKDYLLSFFGSTYGYKPDQSK